MDETTASALCLDEEASAGGEASENDRDGRPCCHRRCVDSKRGRSLLRYAPKKRSAQLEVVHPDDA